LTGNELELGVTGNETIRKLKERIEEKEGIPPDQQRLIFSGRAMADGKTVEDYAIQPGATIHLVLAL